MSGRRAGAGANAAGWAAGHARAPRLAFLLYAPPAVGARELALGAANRLLGLGVAASRGLRPLDGLGSVLSGLRRVVQGGRRGWTSVHPSWCASFFVGGMAFAGRGARDESRGLSGFRRAENER